ncbi:MAG: DUF4340 domain-containing protein [bacterium]
MQRVKISLSLLIFLGIALLFSFLMKKETPPNLFPDLSSATRIEIEEGAILQKVDREWMVILGEKDLAPADKEKVEVFLFRLTKTKEDALISEKKEKHSTFGVDTGMQVKIYKKTKVLADFIVGNMCADFTSIYLRKTNSNKVFLSKNFPYIMKNPNYWLKVIE